MTNKLEDCIEHHISRYWDQHFEERCFRILSEASTSNNLDYDHDAHEAAFRKFADPLNAFLTTPSAESLEALSEELLRPALEIMLKVASCKCPHT